MTIKNISRIGTVNAKSVANVPKRKSKKRKIRARTIMGKALIVKEIFVL